MVEEERWRFALCGGVQYAPEKDRVISRVCALRDFTQPTLILWGEHDSWLRPEFGERLNALIPDSRLSIVPSAGNLPLGEQPYFCNREIMRFLQGDEAPNEAALAAEAETAS